MGSRELIVRLRCSKKKHEIISQLLVSYDHACECLRCMPEAGCCVRLGPLRVPFEFCGDVIFCLVALFVEKSDHLVFKCGQVWIILNCV